MKRLALLALLALSACARPVTPVDANTVMTPGSQQEALRDRQFLNQSVGADPFSAIRRGESALLCPDGRRQRYLLDGMPTCAANRP
jgi:hypothetical protein